MSTKLKNRSLFDVDGVPKFLTALPLAMQHLLAMIVGNITPAIIVSGVVKADAATTTLLIQAAMIAAGLSTLLQIYPIWKFGAKLPVVTGVSFAFVPTLISLGALYGLEGVFGAQLIGGIAAIVVGVFIKRLKKHFPPIVAGTVVLTIGLSLYSVATGYMAGGFGSPEFGAQVNWGIAIFTLLVVLICNQFAKGYTKLASILIGIVAGYLVSIPFGLVDFTAVKTSAWFALPTFMPFKMTFHVDAVITCILVFIVASIEIVGDLSAVTGGACKRDITDKELSGGILGMGISSALATVFGGLPVATYSQNVGLVLMTKVTSRFVIAIAAGFMLVAGFVPKFGALVTTVPAAVLGGATVTVFGMITMAGIQIIIGDELSTRNITIVGLSVALGMGIVGVGGAGALDQFPKWVKVIFGESAVVISSLLAFIFNLLLPKKTLAEEEEERKAMDMASSS
ncbi:uracil-xanthine permease family protein [Clostridium sp. CF012]|uniref:uracil-xanthine permease family protein n=1 Tax=Clostridium sp. CF012 TaxID=2843319 RepID=UPI001C0AC0D3|nr:nucleobase:cation symporter-2 family protein [Clostridium sp. CF012]MBU3146696.1 purine permease [Clostridium sp. CF012]